jgi:two-component system NarL family sensor kinase
MRTLPALPASNPLSGGSAPAAPSIATAVARFMVLSLAAVVLLGGLSVVLTRRLGSEEAVRTAGDLAALVGRTTIAPMLTPELMAGEPEAISLLDQVVRTQVLTGEVVRVKLWTADGGIVYADEPRLIGRAFPLGLEERDALRSGEVIGELSEPSEDENTFERDRGALLETYVPLSSTAGEPVLFEMYQHSTSVFTDRTRLWTTFLPVALGAVLLLWITQGPLAYAMARRLRAGHHERERLLAAAADAARLERRRVASDLHDGTIQHLAGVAYELDASALDVEESGDTSQARRTLREGAGNIRNVIRQLRALVVEITPPDLRDAGLAGTLTDVVAPLAMHGVQTNVVVQPDARGAAPSEALLFRGAQEAVRNIVRHSNASNAEVRLSKEDGMLTLSVTDDGRGIAEGDLQRARDEGHVGLRLLEETVREHGGHMRLTTPERGGTSLTIVVPA